MDRKRGVAALIGGALALMAVHAFGQYPTVQQSGAITPGNVPVWVSNGKIGSSSMAIFTPEQYKHGGDPDDTLSFQRMSTAMNALGGGEIELQAGKNYSVFSTQTTGSLGYVSLIAPFNANGVSVNCNGATITVGYVFSLTYPDERAVFVQPTSSKNIIVRNCNVVQTSQVITLPQTSPVPGSIVVEPGGGNVNITVENITINGGNAGYQSLPGNAVASDENVNIHGVYAFGSTIPAQYGVVLGASGNNAHIDGVYTVGAERTCFIYGVVNVELSCVEKDGSGAEPFLISDGDATRNFVKNVRANFTVLGRTSSGSSASDAYIMLEHAVNNGVLENIDVNFNVDYTNEADTTTPSAVAIYKTAVTGNVLSGIKIHGTIVNAPAVAGHVIDLFDSRSTWSSETVGSLEVGSIVETGSSTPDFYVDFAPFASTHNAVNLHDITFAGGLNAVNFSASKMTALNTLFNSTYYASIPTNNQISAAGNNSLSLATRYGTTQFQITDTASPANVGQETGGTTPKFTSSGGDAQYTSSVGDAIIGSTFTVSTLPACSSTNKGAMAWVTDASSPTYLGTLTGGSTTIAPVFCNGTAWVSS